MCSDGRTDGHEDEGLFYTGTLLKGWRYSCARHRTYGGCTSISPLILKPCLCMTVSSQSDSIAALPPLLPEITAVAY